MGRQQTTGIGIRRRGMSRSRVPPTNAQSIRCVIVVVDEQDVQRPLLPVVAHRLDIARGGLRRQGQGHDELGSLA